MACCILGPPTLSTFPASMCSLRATWADEAISQVQNAGRKGQVRGSKGPSFLLAGSARRGFLAPRAKAHGAVSSCNGFLMPTTDCTKLPGGIQVAEPQSSVRRFGRRRVDTAAVEVRRAPIAL